MKNEGKKIPFIISDKHNFSFAVSDYYQLDDLLTPQEQSLRNRIRTIMEKEVAPIMTEVYDSDIYMLILHLPSSSYENRGESMLSYHRKHLICYEDEVQLHVVIDVIHSFTRISTLCSSNFCKVEFQGLYD